MIHSVFQLASRTDGAATFSAVMFCEGGKARESKLSGSGNDSILQVFSEDSSVGGIIASGRSRSALAIDCCCQGETCFCRSLVHKFMVHEFECKDTDYLAIVCGQNTSNFPATYVFVDGFDCVMVSMFGAQDVVVETVHDGTFSIRSDCVMSSIDSSNKIALLLDRMRLCDRREAEEAAKDALTILHERIEHWPAPARGSGLMMAVRSDASIMLSMDPNSKKRKAVSLVPRPKGAITGFNFFSQDWRKKAMTEKYAHLANNDLNRMLGKVWKEMSAEERRPYLERAEEDKRRHDKEMVMFNMMNGGPPCGDRPKPLTAYNTFVHLERQFVLGCEVNDTQTRIGKHGGDRWSAMSQPEKDLYQAQRDVDVRGA